MTNPTNNNPTEIIFTPPGFTDEPAPGTDPAPPVFARVNNNANTIHTGPAPRDIVFNPHQEITVSFPSPLFTQSRHQPTITDHQARQLIQKGNINQLIDHIKEGEISKPRLSHILIKAMQTSLLQHNSIADHFEAITQATSFTTNEIFDLACKGVETAIQHNQDDTVAKKFITPSFSSEQVKILNNLFLHSDFPKLMDPHNKLTPEDLKDI